jgi:hypothetical protein
MWSLFIYFVVVNEFIGFKNTSLFWRRFIYLFFDEFEKQDWLKCLSEIFIQLYDRITAKNSLKGIKFDYKFAAWRPKRYVSRR